MTSYAKSVARSKHRAAKFAKYGRRCTLHIQKLADDIRKKLGIPYRSAKQRSRRREFQHLHKLQVMPLP